jgi:hypothetical protein
MPPSTLHYELGPAGGLAAERPSIVQLQRAALHALERGDRRRAAAYMLVVRRRVEEAQAEARRPPLAA